MANTGSSDARAANARALQALIKYGPLVYGLARQHAPGLIGQQSQQAQQGRPSWPRRSQGAHGAQPAQPARTEALARAGARRRAAAHARTLVDGATLEVFHNGRRYWVVLAGDEPVGTHPHTDVPFATLLRHADLSRARPARSPGILPGAAARARGATRTGGASAEGRESRPPRSPQAEGDEPLQGRVID